MAKYGPGHSGGTFFVDIGQGLLTGIFYIGMIELTLIRLKPHAGFKDRTAPGKNRKKYCYKVFPRLYNPLGFIVGFCFMDNCSQFLLRAYRKYLGQYVLSVIGSRFVHYLLAW